VDLLAFIEAREDGPLWPMVVLACLLGAAFFYDMWQRARLEEKRLAAKRRRALFYVAGLVARNRVKDDHAESK
jgi:hypothetical protein